MGSSEFISIPEQKYLEGLIVHTFNFNMFFKLYIGWLELCGLQPSAHQVSTIQEKPAWTI